MIRARFKFAASNPSADHTQDTRRHTHNLNENCSSLLLALPGCARGSTPQWVFRRGCPRSGRFGPRRAGALKVLSFFPFARSTHQRHTSTG
eukprot:3897494-Amphidinium_carterae.1